MLVGASAVIAALVAPAMGLLPLYHCQVTAAWSVALMISGSDSVAMMARPTWGCNVDRVTVSGFPHVGNLDG